MCTWACFRVTFLVTFEAIFCSNNIWKTVIHIYFNVYNIVHLYFQCFGNNWKHFLDPKTSWFSTILDMNYPNTYKWKWIVGAIFYYYSILCCVPKCWSWIIEYNLLTLLYKPFIKWKNSIITSRSIYILSRCFSILKRIWVNLILHIFYQ